MHACVVQISLTVLAPPLSFCINLPPASCLPFPTALPSSTLQVERVRDESACLRALQTSLTMMQSTSFADDEVRVVPTK